MKTDQATIEQALLEQVRALTQISEDFDDPLPDEFWLGEDA